LVTNEVVALYIVPEKIEMLNRKVSPIVDVEIEDYLTHKPLNFRATRDTNQPDELMTFIKTIEDAIDQAAKKNFLPMHPGDVVTTYANIDALKRDVGFELKTDLAVGIGNWAAWYRNYNQKS
jgi:nucleoside-diphosphate-sugar epimerase